MVIVGDDQMNQLMKWWKYKMEEFTCARCGCNIETFKFIKNSREIEILGKRYMLHLCNTCIGVFNEKKENI